MRHAVIPIIFAAVVVAIVAPTPFVALADDSRPSESLGNKLLDDLNATPPTPLPTAPAPRGLSPQNNDLLPNGRALRLNAAQPAASALIPLARVQLGMQNAQTILAQPGIDTHAGTVKLANAAQQEVISELDKLIAELSKQCQSCNGGQCNKPPQPDDGNKPGQPKPGSKLGSATARGKAPARDSNDRLDRTTSQPVDKGDVVDAVKHLWGQLPERSRTQMLQTFSDEFLPKYEQDIEQYYRRLSEERPDDGIPHQNK